MISGQFILLFTLSRVSMCPPGATRPNHAPFGRHTNAPPANMDPLAGLRALQARCAAVAARVSAPATADADPTSTSAHESPSPASPDVALPAYMSAEAGPSSGDRRAAEVMDETSEEVVGRPAKKAKVNHTIVSVGSQT